MAKQLAFGVEAREKIFTGVEKVTMAVRTTLGPAGRNVMFDSMYNGSTISKDGVTVAKEIDLADPFENLGASYAKEAASSSNDICGDGSTTVTVLNYAMLKEGLKYVNSGANATSINRGINKAAEVIVEQLKKNSVTVSKENIKNVAAISANNDETLGAIVAQAIDIVGKDGVITVNESKSTQTTVKTEKGMCFHEGYLSSYFVTDKENQVVEFNNAYILLYDKTISSMRDIIGILEKVAQQGGGKPIVIIAENVEGEALTSLVVNNMRGTLKVCCVKAPGVGDARKEFLKDIAAISGGQLISEDVGKKLTDQDAADNLGTVDSIRITKDETTIVAFKGHETEIAERVKTIKKELEDVQNDTLAKEKLEDRLARLSSGVAVIEVGAATETELKEKKYRVEDAYHATKAALEEGIVAGGGTALINAARILTDEYINNTTNDSDERLGFQIVRKAIEQPMYWIARNAGVSGEVVVETVKQGLTQDENFGYNAKTKVYGNMINMGIIDPTKVTRNAIQKAASVAGAVLTTECAITTIPEKEVKDVVIGQPTMMPM